MNSAKIGRCERVVGLVHLVDRRPAEETVGEACGVRHQLANRGRVPGRFERRRAVGTRARVDLERGEFRNVLRERIVGVPLALFIEHHHGDAGDRFRHRIDAEDGVALERRARGEVLMPVGVDADELAVPRDHGHDSRQTPDRRPASASRGSACPAARRRSPLFRAFRPVVPCSAR